MASRSACFGRSREPRLNAPMAAGRALGVRARRGGSHVAETADQTTEEQLTAEQIADASGLSADEVRMLGQPPYDLLVSRGKPPHYRISQISWARTLAGLRHERRLTWLEIRSWAERRQRKR